jgi:hypothetical protein
MIDMTNLNNFSTWRYFIQNYQQNFIAPNCGSHGFMIFTNMNRIFNNEDYKNKYPEIVNDLNKCNEIKQKYVETGRIEDKIFLQNTADKIYDVVPPLFKYAINLNEKWIDKKKSMRFNHNDKTVIDLFFEKVFK